MLEISINMIMDTLTEYKVECLCPEENVFFSGLRLYERGQVKLSPENIYMCTSKELDAVALDSGCYFLCIHKMSPAMYRRCQGRRVVVVDDESITLADGFNAIQKLFTDLREWHQNMHVSLIKNNNVQELLNLSEKAIGNPIVLVDLGFKLLAHTENIQTDDEVYNELVSHGYHTKQNIDRLTQDRVVDSIKKASTIDVEFPLPFVTRYQTMTKTFHIGGVPYAYLRMICSSCPPSRSLEERFSLLAESVEYYLHNHYASGNVSKNVYEYVLVELIEKQLTDEASVEDRASCVGLPMDAEYQLAKIIFEDESNVSVNYMLEQLLVILPESRPFIYKDHIVMLMSSEGAGKKDGRIKLLRDFLDHYHAYCGLSVVFRSLMGVADAYLQTTAAIELGQNLRARGIAPTSEWGSTRIFAYRDYQVYHMITACAKEMRLESICDKDVLTIWERDKRKNTQQVELLRTYLNNKCRPTDTGQAMHMHRNNVIYHVERLSSQYGLDLEDPETCLRLEVSFKVLDLLQGEETESGENEGRT